MSLSLFAIILCAISAQTVANTAYEYMHLQNQNGGDHFCLDLLPNWPDLTIAVCSTTKETQLIGKDTRTDAIHSYNQIPFKINGNVLDVEGGSRYIGASVIQWSAKGQDDDNKNQLWLLLEKSKSKFVQIKNLNSELCLTVNWIDTDVPRIIQNRCDSEEMTQLRQFTNEITDQEPRE